MKHLNRFTPKTLRTVLEEMAPEERPDHFDGLSLNQCQKDLVECLNCKTPCQTLSLDRSATDAGEKEGLK